MKKLKNITVMFVSVLGIVFSIASLNNEVNFTTEAMASGTRTLDTKTTGSLDSGDAIVELTPKIDKNRLIVIFSINTHSVRLSSIDMKTMTTLEYGNKVLKPVKASRVGGHHASGEIIFNIEDDIDSFKIKIKGIPKIEDRVYEWI
jgi:hypothetical protein